MRKSSIFLQVALMSAALILFSCAGHKSFKTAENLMAGGKYDEAIAILRKALQMNIDFLPAHIFLAACYSATGRDAEANASAKEVFRINPKFTLESYAKRLTYKNQADVEREVAALKKAGLK